MRSPLAEAMAAALPSILVATVLLGGGSGCRTTAKAVASPAAVLTATAQANPALRFGPTQTYAGEQLYDFMDGAAVTYLEHHVRVLAAADVFRGEDQAKIELYEMASPDDSARLYAELAASSKVAFAAGEQGCTWAGFEPEALFRRGPYLVRLLGYAKDAGAAASLLVEVGVAIDSSLRAGPR